MQSPFSAPLSVFLSPCCNRQSTRTSLDWTGLLRSRHWNELIVIFIWRALSRWVFQFCCNFGCIGGKAALEDAAQHLVTVCTKATVTSPLHSFQWRYDQSSKWHTDLREKLASSPRPHESNLVTSCFRATNPITAVAPDCEKSCTESSGIEVQSLKFIITYRQQSYAECRHITYRRCMLTNTGLTDTRSWSWVLSWLLLQRQRRNTKTRDSHDTTTRALKTQNSKSKSKSQTKNLKYRTQPVDIPDRRYGATGDAQFASLYLKAWDGGFKS